MAKAQEQIQMAVPNGNGGVAVQQIDPQSLSNLPLATYQQMAGNFVNTQNAVYYDTAVYTAGQPITVGMKKALFTKGKDQEDTVVNTQVPIPEKGDFLTNMIGNGEFEGGTTFILEQIAVHWLLTSEQPTTLGNRGEITAPNYTASVVISAANHAKAISENFVLEYYRTEQLKLRAKLRHFPSPSLMSGAIGSPNAGFIQNGYASTWNILSRPVVLQSEDMFRFVIQPVVPTWTPTASFNIAVELYGKTIKTFQP